jgi:predicted Zn-dependent protease
MDVHSTLSRATLAVAITVLFGCATPLHQSQAVSSQAVEQANREIHALPDPKPRELADAKAKAKVLAIAERLRPGAERVCREIGEDECTWDVRYSTDPNVNAFAAGEDVVVIQQGIVRYANNEDEIALVIAHEMAHHAADHIAETKQNTAAGAVAGAVLLGALTGMAYSNSNYSSSYTRAQVGQAAGAGAALGGAIGRLSFSKAQENEADYLAAYILAQGGYDLVKARGVWGTLARAGKTEHGERHSVNTHPDPAERLARWDLTTQEVRTNGGKLPTPGAG